MKSILLHVHEDAGLDTRVAAAITLAQAYGGHVTCLHVASSRAYLRADPWSGTALAVDFAAEMDRLRLGLKGRVEAILDAADIERDWIHHDAPMADAFVRHSVLSDVIVLSLPGSGGSAHATSFIAMVAANARAPVVAVPHAGPTLDLGGAALVAWDGSGEASMALRGSVPLLARASSVHMIEVEERRPRPAGNQGAAYLARHGIDARTSHLVAVDGDIGHAVIAAAARIDATLIVMGAYGHARLTEYMLGGVTRTLLAGSPVPLLLAH